MFVLPVVYTFTAADKRGAKQRPAAVEEAIPELG